MGIVHSHALRERAQAKVRVAKLGGLKFGGCHYYNLAHANLWSLLHTDTTETRETQMKKVKKQSFLSGASSCPSRAAIARNLNHQT
jgi:hypothetical protein